MLRESIHLIWWWKHYSPVFETWNWKKNLFLFSRLGLCLKPEILSSYTLVFMEILWKFGNIRGLDKWYRWNMTLFGCNKRVKIEYSFSSDSAKQYFKKICQHQRIPTFIVTDFSLWDGNSNGTKERRSGFPWTGGYNSKYWNSSALE